LSITQISKIQLRRGRKSETDLPQLASAEMAWAIDTQELFIGNGSVSEGAPAVGNTRLLTTHDDFFDIAESYQYKKQTPPIKTGIPLPVRVTLQDRLDTEVTNLQFDITSNNSTEKFQNAINTLFANSEMQLMPESRVTLKFLPGEYNFDAPIYIPSYASIVGSGIDKTIFNFTSDNGFILVEWFDYNTGSLSDPSVNPDSFWSTQNCLLSDFTINTTKVGIEFNSVRDSIFENIKIACSYDDDTIGINFKSYSRMVQCEGNYFNNIQMIKLKYGMKSSSYIQNNNFNNMRVDLCTNGLFFTGDTVNNIISNSTFQSVIYRGITIYYGSGNSSCNNRFIDVGDGDTSPILFVEVGNSSTNDFSNGFIDKSSPQLTSIYTPLIEGYATYDTKYINETTILSNATRTSLVRLPINYDVGYTIPYTITGLSSIRKGELSIATNGGGVFANVSNIGELSNSQIFNNNIIDIIFSSSLSLYIAICLKGVIITSSDGTGTIWDVQSSGTTSNLNSITEFNSKLVISSSSGEILMSTDGVNWTIVQLNTTLTNLKTSDDNLKIMAVSTSGNIWFSTDAVIWFKVLSPSVSDIKSSIYANGIYIGVGNNGKIVTSGDGTDWVLRTSNTLETLNNVIYTGSQFIIIGNNGIILTNSNPNIDSWATVSSGVTENLTSIASDGSLSMVVGDNGTMLTNLVGNIWIIIPSTNINYNNVIWSGSNFNIVGSKTNIICTDDYEYSNDNDDIPNIIFRAAMNDKYITLDYDSYSGETMKFKYTYQIQ
jgi:hypothetical protein